MHADARETAAADVLLVRLLIDNGVTESVAERIAIRFPDRIRTQCEAMQFRRNVKDHAAFLVRAIENDFSPPRRLTEIKSRIADEQAAIAARNREADRHLEIQAERASNAMLESLSPEIRWQLEQHVDLKITGIFGGRPIKPDMLHGMRRGFLHEAVRQFRETGVIGGAK